jgi:FkbM family methyltransferase
MKRRNVFGVIDVGANIGQFGIDIRAHGFLGQINSFEPSKAIFQELLLQSQKDNAWSCFNFGLSDYNGFQDLLISRNAGLSSSYLNMRDLHTKVYPQSSIIGAEMTELRRLDSFVFDKEIRHLLKIDVQGYETKVLKGLGVVIQCIDIIYLEVSIADLYEEQASLQSILDFLDSNNFQVADFLNEQRIDGKLFQFDILACRR